ncbi:MAG: MFS transporter [Pseudomonadota bacterium]
MTAVGFILALNTIQNSGLFANRIVLALFALELGASPLLVGVLTALFSMAPAILAVTVGRLADRFGVRWLLVIGSTGAGLGLLLPYFLPSLAAVSVASALCGLSWVCYNVTTQNLTGLLSTPESRARNFTNYSLTTSAGTLLGPLIGGFSIDQIGHAQSCLALALLAFMPLLMLLTRWNSLEKGAVRPADVKAAPTGGTLLLFRDPRIRQTIISASFLSSGLNLFSAYMPVYGRAVGLSASVIGIVMAMNATAAFAIRLLLPRMIAWLKEEKVLALSFCSGAAALVLIPMFQHPVLLGLLAFIFGLGMGAGQPIVIMLIFHFAPAGRSGEAIGLKITTNHLTNIVSPIVFGGIATLLGLSPMFWLNGLMMAAGCYISWTKNTHQAMQKLE